EQNPPVCACIVRTQDFSILEIPENSEFFKNREITEIYGNYDVSEIYLKLNRRETLTTEEMIYYTNWKKELIREVFD
ncbi:MAG: hypothetical protein K2H82_07980, partial [Oscillospiraceae bacterium]|nr:hypothetical protein [Oscillospiraceae bacterium]